MSRYLNEGAVWSAVKRIPHITVQTREVRFYERLQSI